MKSLRFFVCIHINFKLKCVIVFTLKNHRTLASAQILCRCNNTVQLIVQLERNENDIFWHFLWKHVRMWTRPYFILSHFFRSSLSHSEILFKLWKFSSHRTHTQFIFVQTNVKCTIFKRNIMSDKIMITIQFVRALCSNIIRMCTYFYKTISNERVKQKKRIFKPRTHKQEIIISNEWCSKRQWNRKSIA